MRLERVVRSLLEVVPTSLLTTDENASHNPTLFFGGVELYRGKLGQVLTWTKHLSK